MFCVPLYTRFGWLSRSGLGLNIMVIVDRFTKYLIAVLFKETHTAEQLGHLLLDRLVRDHGVLIMIITDRDKLFTSNYWKTISAAMGTKPKMSTAYHP